MAIKRVMGFAEIKPAKMDIYEPFMTEFDIPYRIVIESGKRACATSNVKNNQGSSSRSARIRSGVQRSELTIGSIFSIPIFIDSGVCDFPEQGNVVIEPGIVRPELGGRFAVLLPGCTVSIWAPICSAIAMQDLTACSTDTRLHPD